MRLIDADELLKTNIHIVGSIRTPSGRTQNIDAIQISEIENAPTIDAIPVKHGKWIHNDEWWEFICTSCRRGIGNIKTYKYCPNCGAKMDGDINAAD